MKTLLEQRVQKWLRKPFDLKTQDTVRELMKKNPKELENAFYTDLSFGTGGLRGLMGVGTNRMNLYTVRKTTEGLARYLKKQFSSNISVVIGFDSRHHSKEFASDAADTLSHYGITVYLLKELRPTPYVSFACRHFKAQAAIMITASHNPKEYNGYKVYWQDGAQVVPPHDIGILEEIEAISEFSAPLQPQETLIHIVDDRLDNDYLKAISPLQNFPKENKTSGKELKIVYTSLHGTGITIALKALQDWGFSDIETVTKQIIPDGEFPTVTLPNPEYKEALQLGIDLLQSSQADLLLATDPDADRLGVVAMHKGVPVILNGNEIASLCIEYLCRAYKKNSHFPPHPAFVTTVVSTDLLDAIGSFYKIPCFRVLTGFKYIGEKIHEWEMNKKQSFIFGAEESYGYLFGTHSRDKDAIVSCCMLSEMSLFLKKQGKTLVDFLEEIYKTYGIFREGQTSIEFSPGKEGMESMKNLMDRLRKIPPKEICDEYVMWIEDYLQGIKGLPPSDMIIMKLHDDSKVIIRPSGTEPKVKIYAGVRLPFESNLEEEIKQADLKLEELLKQCKKLALT